MSSAPNLHLLRARIAERLEELLAPGSRHSRRGIGRAVGRSGQAVAARGDDPNAWPFLELSDFAAELDEQLSNALVAYIRRESGAARTAGEATRLRDDEKAELLSNARIDQAVLADFDHSTPAGRAAIREAIAARRLIENRLLADFDMVDGVRRD